MCKVTDMPFILRICPHVPVVNLSLKSYSRISGLWVCIYYYWQQTCSSSFERLLFISLHKGDHVHYAWSLENVYGWWKVTITETGQSHSLLQVQIIFHRNFYVNLKTQQKKKDFGVIIDGA